MQKLCLAEDTSNIDETGVSSNEVREREKKRRRIKAKKYMSSSSEDDLCSYKKHYSVTQEANLFALPQKQHFVSNDKELLSTSTQATKDILCENNAVNRNGEDYIAIIVFLLYLLILYDIFMKKY